MKAHHKEHLSKFTKYCVVNAGTFAVDVAMARIAVVAGLSTAVVSPLSFITLSVVSYFLLHHWVFHDHTKTYSEATFLFALLVFVQALIVGISMPILVGRLHLMPEIARMMVGVVVFVIGYLACHYFIFTKHPRKTTDAQARR